MSERKSVFVGETNDIEVELRHDYVVLDDCDFQLLVGRDVAAELARVLAYFAEHGTLPEQDGER